MIKHSCCYVDDNYIRQRVGGERVRLKSVISLVSFLLSLSFIFSYRDVYRIAITFSVRVATTIRTTLFSTVRD